MEVYLESGAKRVFAGALDWPGWSRSGRDEEGALEALVAYAPRYALAVRGAVTPAFRVPDSLSDLHVVERLTGDATTDFGAPSIAPSVDGRTLAAKDFARLRALLHATWSAFDRAVAEAEGVELTKGPRGGGRDVNAIVTHVVDAEGAYARRLGPKRPAVDEGDGIEHHRAVVLDSLDRGFADGLPAAGPRGGKIWAIPYFVRRAGWHVLDHAWEIEDRSTARRGRR